MKNLEAVAEDHARAPVPDCDRIGAGKMALVITNGVVCVPAILVGSQIAAGAGLRRAVTSFFIGGAVLATMAALTAMVGARANLSTYMITQLTFGQRGGRWVNSVLLGSILFIYAVIAAVFGRALHAAIAFETGFSASIPVCTVTGSALMVLVIIFGFRSLELFARIVVPLLLALVGAMLLRALTGHGAAPAVDASHPMSARSAISAVIGSYIIGVVVLPDLLRYARSVRSGVTAAAFSLALALPLFLAAAGFISATAGPRDLTALIIALGLGAPALLALTFASWTNNAANLYSSALAAAALVPSMPKWKLTIAVGAVGTAMALLPVLDHFLQFLLAISILMPPLAGIYTCDFLLRRATRATLADLAPSRPIDYPAMLIWLLSVGVGYASSRGLVHLSSVPGVDAMASAFALHALATRRPGCKPGAAVS